MVVYDADDMVADVVLSNGKVNVAAARLPGGLHLTTAKLEGDVVIRCWSGLEINLGYITSTSHLRQTVCATDCAARTA